MLKLLSVVILASVISVGLASIGDRSRDYNYCLSYCVQSNCSNNPARWDTLTWQLHLFLWTCGDDCRYSCMHQVTSEDVQAGRPIRQFYGKWPFIRYLGIQEPASVTFSLLNLATHLYSFRVFHQRVPKDYPYLWIIRFSPLAATNTWVWSVVFHTRDVSVTEKLDYFSGTLLVVYMLIFQFIRITGPSARLWHFIYTCLVLSLYLTHIGYLSLVHFDYGYNMMANVVAGNINLVMLLGGICTAVWAIWCLKHYGERPYVWKCFVSIVCNSLFILLELLDFPPLLWTFDAHSLWHMSTIPLPLLWYRFLLDDALFGKAKTRKAI